MSGLLNDGLDDGARRLVSRAFISLWHGTSPSPLDVAAELDPEDAAEVFRVLTVAGRCELDGDGRIVGVHGITRRATRHQIVHATGRHHTWCAFDAVGIPAAVGIDATAETACPRCDSPIAIEILGGEPTTVGSMVVLLPADPGRHLIDDFCSTSNIFCSLDHLEGWVSGSAIDGQVVTITDAAELGRETWADVADVVTGGEPNR